MGPSNRQGASAVVAQGGEESRGLPLALRDLVDEPLAPWRPSRVGGSYWSCPGFIDEDQPPGINALLIGSPDLCPGDPARARQASFFERKPRRRRHWLISEVPALTPRSASTRSQSLQRRKVRDRRLR